MTGLETADWKLQKTASEDIVCQCCKTVRKNKGPEQGHHLGESEGEATEHCKAGTFTMTIMITALSSMLRHMSQVC